MPEIVVPLTVRALADEDLPSCSWSGSPLHLTQVARELDRAELGVEESNPRARKLYERLGYAAYGSKPDGWDVEGPDGSTVRYETMCVLMRKSLSLT